MIADVAERDECSVRDVGPVSVVVFPDCEWLEDWNRFQALTKHLLQCSECCSVFGASVQLLGLHPLTVAEPDELEAFAEARRAPVPAFSISTCEPLLADLSDSVDKGAADAVSRTMLDALERQYQAAVTEATDTAATTVASSSRGEILSESLAWFRVYFERVHRVIGARQRRIVEIATPIRAERVFATFWAEAALLMRDCSPVACATEGADDAPDSVHEQPADAVSSLIVLPGLADPEAFKGVRQSLALSLALLGLESRFTLSAFHPRDTFQIVESAEDGSRQWQMSLPHPLVHLVAKVNPTRAQQ